MDSVLGFFYDLNILTQDLEVSKLMRDILEEDIRLVININTLGRNLQSEIVLDLHTYIFEIIFKLL